MVYIHYEHLKVLYIRASIQVDKILREKEELFQRTQPQGITAGEKVQSSVKADAFDRYLIAVDEQMIDARLSEAKKILEERKNLLTVKEFDLRMSKDLDDMVYVMRYLEHMKIREIAESLHYSEAHIYRITSEIRRKIKVLKNDNVNVV